MYSIYTTKQYQMSYNNLRQLCASKADSSTNFELGLVVPSLHPRTRHAQDFLQKRYVYSLFLPSLEAHSNDDNEGRPLI